jgi:hypothetical protein
LTAVRCLKTCLCAAACVLLLGLPLGAAAQTAPPPAAPTATAVLTTEDPDLDINVIAPDFALTALPTTLRMPAGKFAFRMTHRFSRPIAGTCPDEGPKPDGCGGIGAFVENFFGFDSSSKVGLELRYGVMPGTQVVLHRTNDRAIQMLAQHQLFPHRGWVPAGSGITPAGPMFGIDLVCAVEGQNNFRRDHTITVGAIASYQVRDQATIYAQPMLLFNSNPVSDSNTDDNHTVMLGVGGRLRLGQSKMYLVAEAAPRLAGFKPGVDHISFGFESRAGGHMFQFNVSNSFGSTLRQVALGGPGNGDWFLRFNLSRRFF